MGEVTAPRRLSDDVVGKIFPMTSTTSSSPVVVVDDSVVATAAQDQRDAERAEARAALAASGTRMENAGWIALALGLVISLGVFGSIAWHDSVSARGDQSVVQATTAP